MGVYYNGSLYIPKDGMATKTEEDFDIYVNASTGNDSNDGLSAATAKLTLNSGIGLIPDVVAHNINVNISGSFDESFDLLGRTLENGAKILFDGGTAVTVISTDTATSSTVATITVTGAGWAVNEHAGKFCKPAGQDEVRQVYSNTSDTLTFFEDFTITPPGTGDFSFVRPTTTIGASGFELSTVDGITGSGNVEFQRLTYSGSHYLAYSDCSVTIRHNGCYFGTTSSLYTPKVTDCTIVSFSNSCIDPLTGSTDTDWEVGNYWSSTGSFSADSSDLALSQCVFNDVTLTNCSFQGSFGGPVFTDLLSLNECGRRSDALETLKTSGKVIRLDAGLYAKSSIVSLDGNIEINNPGGHCIELEDSTLHMSGGIVSGSAHFDGAGLYAHSGSKCFYDESYPPTITSTGIAGDVSIDGISEASTWSDITYGVPFIESDTDQVLVKSADPIYFDISSFESSVGDQSPVINITGADLTPDLYLLGEDATATTWPAVYGSDMVYTSAGTAIAADRSPVTTDISDRSVLFTKTGDYFTSGDALNFGLQDGIIEVTARFISGTSTPACIYTAPAGAPTGSGFIIFYNAGAITVTAFDVNGVTPDRTVTFTYGEDQWFHLVIFFCKNTDLMRCYVNGITSGTASLTGTEISSVENLKLGYDGSVEISQLGIWSGNGILTSDANQAFIDERFSCVAGLCTTTSKGKNYATNIVTTTTFSRPLFKYNSVTGEDEVHWVGKGWPRASSALIGGKVKFFLSPDPPSANNFTDPGDISQVSWTPGACTIDTTSTDTDIYGNLWRGIVGTAVSTTHYVDKTETGAAAGPHITYWIVSPGDKDWVMLEANGIANSYAYIYLPDGTLGAVGAAFKDVFWKKYEGLDCYLVGYHHDGSAGAHTHRIYPSTGGVLGDETYTGDGSTVDIWVGAAQHESIAAYSYSGVEAPSSWVPVQGSARSSETVVWTDSANIPTSNFKLTIEFCSTFDVDLEGLLFFGDVSDGSATDFIQLYFNSTETIGVTSSSTSVQTASSTTSTFIDSEIHKLEFIQGDRYYSYRIDGGPWTDKECLKPIGIDRVGIGGLSRAPTGAYCRYINILNFRIEACK